MSMKVLVFEKTVSSENGNARTLISRKFRIFMWFFARITSILTPNGEFLFCCLSKDLSVSSILFHGLVLVTRCPSCRSETSMRDCDRNVEMNTCTGHDMRCVVYEVKHGEFIRECMDSDKYEVSENNFKQFSVCRGDECMARLPLCQVTYGFL